jgi:hypothetical protein
MRREFVSYPKSGRSWVRFILTQLRLSDSVTFHHDRFEFNDPTKPPHNFDLESRLRHYGKVERLVYLERDPRDVMVSLYFQVTGRFRDFFGYNKMLGDFVRDDYFGAHNLRRFREMWAKIVARHGFLSISYEAFHADPLHWMREILSYYDLNVSPEELGPAIASSRFEEMKRLEESGKFPQPWLRLRNEAPKIRRGKAGGYFDYLDPACLAYLNDLFELPG